MPELRLDSLSTWMFFTRFIRLLFKFECSLTKRLFPTLVTVVDVLTRFSCAFLLMFLPRIILSRGDCASSVCMDSTRCSVVARTASLLLLGSSKLLFGCL